MNVAFVSNVVYPFVKGGAEKRIHEIGTRLVERGHEVTIYSRHWWDGPETIEHEGMTLRGAGEPRELYAGDRRSIREGIEFGADVIGPLRAHIDEHDVVVASLFPYFPVFGAKLAGLGRETPFVVTWLEVWGDYWSEYLGPAAMCGKAVERVTAKVPHHSIAISGATADKLSCLGPRREDIDIVPGGLDVSRIRETSPAQEGFDVLFAGRLIADKNVDMLLAAFDQVAETHDATLGIVGEGPRYDALRRQAADLGCSDRVTFTGFLDDYDDVLAQMRAANLFVSPSTREGFGITLAEAMAAECRVVTVRHPDSAGSDVVGEGGFVTDSSTPALIEAIDRALDGAKPPRNPITVAREYDWDVVATKAERAYRRAIDDGDNDDQDRNESIVSPSPSSSE
jgi:glycosyltransferase involved in cell wall biosynthesis